MKTHLIKFYHGYEDGRITFNNFLDEVCKTLKHKTLILGLNYDKGEYFFSITSAPKTLSTFETQFYTAFNNFQLAPDVDNKVRNYNYKKTMIGHMALENGRFGPFHVPEGNDTDFIFNIFRTFESLNVIYDKIGLFVELNPIVSESISFYVKSKIDFLLFRMGLSLKFYKYLFNHKVQKNRKKGIYDHFHDKLHHELFRTKCYILCQSDSKNTADARIRSIANNFKTFENYPSNEFHPHIHAAHQDTILKCSSGQAPFSPYILSSHEISAFFHFPANPKNETSLLKVTAKKLALPIGVPTYDYDMLPNSEIVAKGYPDEANIIGITDYRSIKVPVGIYDEDRLRHIYIVGKTGVGKSKFIVGLVAHDMAQGKGLALIDPHGDLVEEAMMHIPESRKNDVIIFDPTDDKFPFCLNPLDVQEDESKQVLAKGFIDIFKKFFGTNRNSMLEHVLRMIFLALLDKKGSTLFDIIRALTDKDFRYDMIEAINDDVVRNFWTNEFAGRSQQFNTEAIMPILNKIGQILSIDALKNIFASTDNKLDFRKVMDEKKILLVKLSKGKLQEDIMGFLGAMFVTKIFQAAMSRQNLAKGERIPFFFYVDEFQNFATETFNEILSEARKYGLGLTVAHQFISQIPPTISDALFGNVGNLISFRISSEDATYMKQHFDPYLGGYDLSNLNQREFYIKMQVKGQVKDPFSCKSAYTPDPIISKDFITTLYETSRTKYNRTLAEAKKVVEQTQKDVIEKLDDFSSPII